MTLAEKLINMAQQETRDPLGYERIALKAASLALREAAETAYQGPRRHDANLVIYKRIYALRSGLGVIT